MGTKCNTVISDSELDSLVSPFRKNSLMLDLLLFKVVFIAWGFNSKELEFDNLLLAMILYVKNFVGIRYSLVDLTLFHVQMLPGTLMAIIV